jgi:hypothetical protein
VIKAFDKMGICADLDGEELEVKRTNEFPEHYDVNYAEAEGSRVAVHGGAPSLIIPARPANGERSFRRTKLPLFNGLTRARLFLRLRVGRAASRGAERRTKRAVFERGALPQERPGSNEPEVLLAACQQRNL